MYIRLKISKSCALSCSTDTLVIRPKLSKSPTEVAVTPGAAKARGNPLPKLTAVSGLSPDGSISRVTRANHPSVAIFVGLQVCQISIARKCERLEFSYPIP